MRFSGLLVVLHVAMVCMVHGQSIVINELYNSSGNGEWVELLVLQDSLDVRGWSLRDFSSGGTPQPPLAFTSAALWSAIPTGTVIVICDAGFTGALDTDPSDQTLTLIATDAVLFSGTVFAFAGASDAIHIRDAANAHVFGVSWGTANAASLGTPKAHFTGTLASGTVIAFQGGSLVELVGTGNWLFANATATRGMGNSTANLAWISSLRASVDGSGRASIDPDTLVHGQTTTLHIGYTRDTAFTVTDLRVIIPPAFTWSHSAFDVSLANLTATLSVMGDTIVAAAVALNGDSCTIAVQSVIAPESTGFYPVTVQSKAAAQFRNVAPVPFVVVFGIPTSIASVKANNASGITLRTGQLVTIRGIVTVANQFGGPSYVQDNTGGIGIFGSKFSAAVEIGDEVIVSGTVEPFNGLSELTSPELHTIASTGNAVLPLSVTCADIANDGAGGVENFEGVLVRINGVVVRNAAGAPLSTWAIAGGGTNYKLLDATDTLEVRVDDLVDFANTPAPQGTFDIVGVAGQYKLTLPYIGGYQLLPRSSEDILATGPGIAALPVESEITPVSFRLTWRTNRPGTTALRAGTSAAYELGALTPDSVQRTEHTIVVGGLHAATVYLVQVFSVSGVDTSWGSPVVISTASPAAASGAINVYFNKSVMPSVVTTPPAAGSQNLVTLMAGRFNSARRSIDAAFYSLSGTPGADIANALIAARARGVRVRVICEQDNRTTAPLSNLVSAGIPLITDTFDGVNAGAGLMHNKFAVIDGRGGAPESVWVWTGSWNPTLPGTNDDYQNAVEIQDPALAGAYTLEFDEMWGSSTDTPGPSTSRFGARKTDNTPHRFRIGQRDVECYFSPSDRTTGRIAGALASATHSINFALLTFTRDDLADAMLARQNAGVTVHGLMDNRDDSGSEYDYLLGRGLDLHLKTGTGLLHHKYAILDAGWAGAHPAVITGSHNWSSAAENSNNENTLIIRDAAIANLYLQEFAARYYQFGGTGDLTVDVDSPDLSPPLAFALFPNFPNPFNPGTTIRFSIANPQFTTLKVYDLLGREVAVLVDEVKPAGNYSVHFDASGLASGLYFARLQSATVSLARTMLLLR